MLIKPQKGKLLNVIEKKCELKLCQIYDWQDVYSTYSDMEMKYTDRHWSFI